MGKRKKKPKPYMVGKCGYCEKFIYSDEKYEILAFARPSMWEDRYKKGPVHNRCRLPMYKRFNRELMRDVETMAWFTKGLVNDKKNKAPLKVKKKRAKRK